MPTKIRSTAFGRAVWRVLRVRGSGDGGYERQSGRYGLNGRLGIANRMYPRPAGTIRRR